VVTAGVTGRLRRQFLTRELTATLVDTTSAWPATMLTGWRQAGKTSLLVKPFPEHTYVSLDVSMIAEEAEHSGGEFLMKYPPPVIIDEVQYAPILLRHVKADIDTHRHETGRFLISGSQRFPLMEGVTESIAGRSSVLTLNSLSANEYESWSGQTLDREAIVEWMLLGGYPELHSRDLVAMVITLRVAELSP
jgi:predicted AAA+ superfamily ATPase